jgi:hypothetical protein
MHSLLVEIGLSIACDQISLSSYVVCSPDKISEPKVHLIGIRGFT